MSDYKARFAAILKARGCSSMQEWHKRFPGQRAWLEFADDGIESCAWCGVVRRADDQNKPCRGYAAIVPR